MATKAQRAQSIADSLLNNTATTPQITRLADAFAVNRHMEPSSLTQGQKADLFIATFREFALGELKRSEGEVAAQAARAIAHGGVDADFTELP